MWSLILLAGGSGSRMGAGVNKVLLPLNGKPVLRRSAEAFAGLTDEIIVAARPEDEDAIRQALDGIPFVLTYGGSTRQESVWNGLQAISPESEYVMIHDGARCLVDRETILGVKDSVLRHGTGIASIPVTDTIKVASGDGLVQSTPDRSSLRSIQTPQGFRTAVIRDAHLEALKTGFIGTDDASLLEHMGLPVHLTEGSRRNLKLTTPEDLQMAASMLNETTLPSLRIGQGYDVHRLVEGRKLILCGVEVPHTLGLLGHSDADVALHALMDAMLGAMALGDIGKHFPDTDEQYKGISSMKLLEHVVSLLKDRRAMVTNCDVTIVAQKPKLLPYIPQMRENVAQALGLPADRVNIKATTTEKLGFEGQQEGISAQAVCMVMTQN